ncbi:MAG: hypothetical protein HC802_12000 [Caldilineaceae bacterium]|nr:hypothetical protein [Caldilineaceae bacterium]
MTDIAERLNQVAAQIGVGGIFGPSVLIALRIRAKKSPPFVWMNLLSHRDYPIPFAKFCSGESKIKTIHEGREKYQGVGCFFVKLRVTGWVAISWQWSQ